MNDILSTTLATQRGMSSLTALFYGRRKRLDPLAEFFAQHFNLLPGETGATHNDRVDEWDNRRDEDGIQLRRIRPETPNDTTILRLVLNGPQRLHGIDLVANSWRELREQRLDPALKAVPWKERYTLWGMTLLFYAGFEPEPDLDTVEWELLPATRRDGSGAKLNYGRAVIHAAGTSEVPQNPSGWLWLLDWPEVNPIWHQSYSTWDAPIVWGAVAPVTALGEYADWLVGEGSNFLLANLYAHKGYDTISQHRRATGVHDFHEKLDRLIDKVSEILQGQPSASAEQYLAELRRPYGSLIEADVLHQKLLVGLRRYLVSFDSVLATLKPMLLDDVGLAEIRRSLERGIQELEMLVEEGQPGVTAGQQALATAMADVAQQRETRAKDTELHLKAFERRLTVLGLVLAAIAALLAVMQVVDRTVVTELALRYWNPLGLGALPAAPDAPKDAHLLLRFLGQLIIAALLVGPFIAILAMMFLFRERRGSGRVRA